MLRLLITTNVWQHLDAWDKWLFIQINNHLSNPFFDWVLPYIRDSVFWAPLYIFLLVFSTLNYGKKGWWWCLFFICTVAFTDLVSSRFLKDGFERLRPCQDPHFFQQVRLLLGGCPGSYSFTSSHAANHFGIATFISITLHPAFRNWIYLAYLWAFSISYAQVYVGVHYPLDVLGGAAVGTMAGLLSANLFTHKVGSFTLVN